MMDEDMRKGKVTTQLADQFGGPGKGEASSFAGKPQFRPISSEEVKQLREGFDKGKDLKDMAKELGRSEGALRRKANDAEIDIPQSKTAKSNAWTPEEHATFIKMKAEGATNAEIAKEIGKTPNAVIGRTNREGMSNPNDPRALGRRYRVTEMPQTERNKPSLPTLKFMRNNPFENPE